MGNRSSMDPYGGVTPQIDKMIGDAYPNVEIVAKNIDAVVTCAENIDAIIDAAGMLQALNTQLASVMARLEALEAQSTPPVSG